MIKKTVVLLTEDSTVEQQLYKICQVKDIELAIENSRIKFILKILEKKFNMVFIDLNSYDNTDIELIRILKMVRSQLPIITLSTDNSIATLRKFAENGIFYYALKPIRAEEIEIVLNSFIPDNEKLKAGK